MTNGGESAWAQTSFSEVAVGGIPFAVATMDEAVGWTIKAALAGEPVPVRLANAYSVALAQNDLAYGSILRRIGVNFPDGTPVALAMKVFGGRQGRKASRVRGPSYFETCVSEGRQAKVQHFFLGTTETTLSSMIHALGQRYPGVRVAGNFAPPFSDLNQSFVELCRDAVLGSGANIVWVGLGTPKQDFLASALAGLVGVPCIGVGAAFDFVAGTVQEAPPWIQRSGLEWLFRLTQDPRRLWRRYVFGNLQFVGAVLRRNVFGFRKGDDN